MFKKNLLYFIWKNTNIIRKAILQISVFCSYWFWYPYGDKTVRYASIGSQRIMPVKCVSFDQWVLQDEHSVAWHRVSKHASVIAQCPLNRDQDACTSLVGHTTVSLEFTLISTNMYSDIFRIITTRCMIDWFLRKNEQYAHEKSLYIL